MTHIILDCKKTFCVHYYGQCEFERMARIDKNEVYCEEFESCYNTDANIHDESNKNIDTYGDKEK